MTLPQVPTPAGIPESTKIAMAIMRGHIVAEDFGFYVTDKQVIESRRAEPSIPWEEAKSMLGTQTDPSRLKALEKAVKTAKPMGSK